MNSAASTPGPIESAGLSISASLADEFTKEALAAASPTDIVDTLIQRGRFNANPGMHLLYQDKYSGVTDEQLLTTLAVFLTQSAGTIKIVPSHGTTIACTKCARLNAPSYYLKRSHGRYAVLCFDNGQGCWERSATSLCSYVDQTETQCMDLAEWVVAYGPDMIKERHVCGMHISGVLSDVTEHRIFALQD